MDHLAKVARGSLEPEDRSKRAQAFSRGNWIGGVFLGLCLLGVFRPLAMIPELPDEVAIAGFPGWSALHELERSTPLALSARDARFARQFPGKIAAFAGDGCTWIVRWVAQPTRKLHPAADCLRATGYEVRPEPVFSSNDGTQWGAISASRGDEKLIVRERIVDSQGHSFTDVSAWFWSATFEKSQGPWWCLTRIEPAPSR